MPSIDQHTEWPARRHYPAAAMFFLAVAAYGSVVPFDYQPMPLADAWSGFLSSMRSSPERISRTDFVVNVALFVPVGFFLLGALLGGGRSSAGRVASACCAVVVFCAVASVLIEFSQMWVRLRTTSALDVLAQGFGTLSGIGLWLLAGGVFRRWIEQFARSRSRTSHVGGLLFFYFVGMTIYLLFPMDLTIRPAELWQKYKAGRIVLMPLADIDSLAAVVAAVSHAAAWTPIGVMTSTLFTTEQRPLRSSLPGLVLGCGLVLALFCARLLVVSTLTATTDLATGGVGVAIGVLAAHWWWSGLASITDRPAANAQPAAVSDPVVPRLGMRWLLTIAAGYCLVLSLLFCAPPADGPTWDADPQRVKSRLIGFFRPPLASLYRGSIFNAVKEVIRKVGLFAPLGVLGVMIVVAWDESRRNRRMLLAVWLATCGLFAFALEMLQVFIPGHTPDLTDVILCTAGAALGAWIYAKRVSSR